MKTRLALIVIALLAVCAYAATSWKANESTPVAPESTLLDDDALTVKTVYATTLSGSPITIAGEEFTHYIQVRNAELPAANSPNGTEQSGSTSLVVTAKKDVTLTVYYRRQPKDDAYISNDGKDLKLFNRADMALLDGTLTLDSKTADEKYGYVTKVYELTEGASYTFSAKGTTIQFFGLTYEEAAPPAPTVGEAIEISPESGKDIAAELATAMADNPYPSSVTINLAAGGEYTVGQTIPVAGALTVKGDEANPAVIDASALTGPLFAVSTTLPESLKNELEFFQMGDVSIEGISVKGLSAQFFFGSGVKSLINSFTFDNSIIEMNGGSKNIFDFAGGGVVGNFIITTSTIYSKTPHTGFIYSSQSGNKATEAGLEMQFFILSNSTFYNVANGKNTFNHRQTGQKWLSFSVIDCISIDAGKSGQFIKGLNGGQASANPVWYVSGFSSQYTVDGVLTDVTASESTGDDEEPVTNAVEGLIAFTGDYTQGDFTLADCPQKEALLGDPRWIIGEEPVDIVINAADGQDLTTLLDAELAKEPAPKSITFNLELDANYTVSGPLNISCPLEINGANNGIDASALTGPMILVNTTEGNTADENGFYPMGDIIIKDINVKGLPAQFIYGNSVKALFNTCLLQNSIIEMNGGSKNIFDFAGGGVVGNFIITTSTIYSKTPHTGFIYSSQSGNKATEAGLEMQFFILSNSTFYNVANGKNTFNHRQTGQKWLSFSVIDCISIDAGKNGQFIKGLNGGQASANPVWDVRGYSSQYTVEGVLTDVTASESTGDAEEPVTNAVEGLIAFTGDYTQGDFTMATCPQNNARIGDPRWINEDAITDIIFYVEDGQDITAALNAELVKIPSPTSITINLASDANFTVSGPLKASCPFVLQGANSSIDASALAEPMILVSLTEGNTPLENEFYPMGDIFINGINVKGLPAQFIYGSGLKSLFNSFTLTNSIIEVNGGSKNIFDFSGGGVVVDFKVTNSTIYSKTPHTGSIYSSQSGQKVTDAGFDAQYFTFANSTFYNVAYGKNTFTHRQNGQKWLYFNINSCVSIDTGKSGQFVRCMNAGQPSANPVWNVSGISSQYTVDGVLTDVTASESTSDSAEPVISPVEGLIAFAADYTTGDFTMASCAQNSARIGDPRWLTDISEIAFEITDEGGYATYFNSEHAYVMPEGVVGGPVVRVDNKQSIVDYIYKAGDVVPAGTPLVLKGEVKAYTVAITNEEGTAPADNLLMGYDAFYPKTTEPSFYYYKLSRSTVNDVKKLGFFWFTADGHTNLCGLNKAYLALTAEEAANFYILLDDEADAIVEVNTDIDNRREVYTINGVRVNSDRLTPGIYIINGKKTVVK